MFVNFEVRNSTNVYICIFPEVIYIYQNEIEQFNHRIFKKLTEMKERAEERERGRERRMEGKRKEENEYANFNFKNGNFY